MATELLTTAKLKATSDKDVGSILNDGGGLRGRVRRNRSGEYPFSLNTNTVTARNTGRPR
jgi:hypothetical protein